MYDIIDRINAVVRSVNNLSDGAHIGASALQGRMVYADTLTRKEAVIVKTKTA